MLHVRLCGYADPKRGTSSMKKPSQERRIWVRILAMMIVILLLLSVVSSSLFAWADEGETLDRYELHLDVLLDEQAVRVTQTIDYTNKTGDTLENMFFSVYANILRRQTTVPMESDQFDNAFPNGYAAGGVDFMNIEVNGQKAEWGIQGDSESFVRVACSLKPNERAQFRFEYYLLLPIYSGAMGIGDLTWRLVNFYPIAAVWDEYLQDFPLGGYTSVIEPLYSECADYFVTLSLPETYALAAPGQVTATPDGEGTVFYEIEARSVRELALIFSRKMIERRGTSEQGTDVRVLANTASAADVILNAAINALNDLENRLCVYPWERLTLIETEYLNGGLSHPGVIQVSQSLTGLTQRNVLKETVYNLCAHQYFGGMVGNDRNSAPWLSDALSSYVTLLRHTDGTDDTAYLRAFNAQILPALQITVPGGMTVDSPAERFTSRMEYEIVVIDRGAVVLHDMRQVMGHDVFFRALSEYVRRMSMKNATAADFLEVMNEVSGTRWNEYLYGTMHNMNDLVGTGIKWYE